MHAIQNPSPTVFIIDDEVEVRNSLNWLIGSINLPCELYDNGIDFLNHYDIKKEGCILLDVRMPHMSGLELLESLNALKNTMPVLILTGYADVPVAVRAIKSGADDFILKPYNSNELLEKIQTLVHKILTPSPAKSPTENKKILLTNREKQIMKMIIKGKLNKQMAYDLNISISTVEFHRARLMKKMGAKNVAELVSLAVRLGMQ